MSRALTVLAPAKINLTLEVLGRRDDGYHELRSVFATLDLADRVRVAAAHELTVSVVPPVACAPEDELATRAARALASALGREPRVRVTVRKRIPVAAGLGGGSSDAGATLRGLARLWRSDADLVAIAAGVGSDVPFFASGARLALVGGRGDTLRPLPPPTPPLWIALVRLPARLATAEVFGALGEVDRGDGAASGTLAAALERGVADVALARECATNDLLHAAERLCPPIAAAREAARAKGIALHLSGSGPSLFALADDRADAFRVARMLRRLGLRSRPQVLG